MSSGRLFILSAPSGAGKTTVVSRVVKNLDNLHFSISHTTRKPRKGERDGVEYFFVDVPTFEKLIREGDFLEYAHVHGNYYGTSRTGVTQQLETEVDVMLDIDVQGARIIRDTGELPAVYIFLAPPDLDELEKRLRGRGLDDDETVATRLKNATLEMTAMAEYDHVIVNDIVEDASRMLEAVVLAERSRAKRDIQGKPLEVVTTV